MEITQMTKAIRDAIKGGHLNKVRDLLEKNPEMLTWITPFGTWLHVATAYGHLEIVQYLIRAGIDVNAQGGTFSTNALERAAAKGHIDSEPDRNPLFAAIYNGHFEMVKLLVENHINISITYSGENIKEMDAYTFAIERGQIEIAEYLKGKLK
jgi:uncharacterized protein